MSDCLNCNPCPRQIYDQPLVPVAILCDTTSGGTTVVDTEPVCLTDSSGTQFFGVLQFDESGTFVGMQFYTVDALGNLIPYAPTSNPVPCRAEDIEEVSDCYIAINNGVGYNIGDQITVTRWYDTSVIPPLLLSTVFYNKSTLTPILAVPAVDLSSCFEDDIETQQVLCDFDPITGELLGRAWFELHFDADGSLGNTVVAGVHFNNPGVVERPYVPVGTLGDCNSLITEYNVCFEEIANPGVILRGVLYTRYNQFNVSEVSLLFVDELGNEYLPAAVNRVACPIAVVDDCERITGCNTIQTGGESIAPGSAEIAVLSIDDNSLVIQINFTIASAESFVNRFIENFQYPYPYFTINGTNFFRTEYVQIEWDGVTDLVTIIFNRPDEFPDELQACLPVNFASNWANYVNSLTSLTGQGFFPIGLTDFIFNSVDATVEIVSAQLVKICGSVRLDTRNLQVDLTGYRTTEHLILCDTDVDNNIVRFIRFFVIDENATLQSFYNTEIDGITPYIPVGTVALCSDVVAYEQCWESDEVTEVCPNNIGSFSQDNPGFNCALTQAGVTGFFSWAVPINNVSFHYNGADGVLFGVISSPTLGGIQGLLANQFGITALTPATAQVGTFTATMAGVDVTMIVQGGGVYNDGAGILVLNADTVIYFEFSTTVTNLLMSFSNMIATNARFDTFRVYNDQASIQYHQVVFTDGTVLWFDQFGNPIADPNIILRECDEALVVAYDQCWEVQANQDLCPNNTGGFSQDNPGSNCALTANNVNGTIQFTVPIDNIQFATTGDDSSILGSISSPTLGGAISLLATLFGITALTPATAETGTFTATVLGITITLTVFGDGGVYNDGAGNLVFANNTNFWFQFSSTITAPILFVFANILTTTPTRIFNFVTYIDGEPTRYHQTVYTNGTDIWFDAFGNLINEPQFVLTECEVTLNAPVYEQCWESPNFVQLCPDNFGGFTPTPDNCNLIANGNNGSIQYNGPIDNVGFHATSDTNTILAIISSPTLGGVIPTLATLFGITALTPATAQTGTFTAIVLGITITLTVGGFTGGVYDDGAGNLVFIDGTIFHFDFSSPVVSLVFGFSNLLGSTITNLSNFISYVAGDVITYHQVVYEDGSTIWFDAFGNIINQPLILLERCSEGCELEPVITQVCYNEDVDLWQSTTVVNNLLSVNGFVNSIQLQIVAGPLFNYNFPGPIPSNEFDSNDLREALESIIETNNLDITLLDVLVSQRISGFDTLVTAYGADIPNGFNILVLGIDINSFFGAPTTSIFEVRRYVRQYNYINCDGNLEFIRYFDENADEVTDQTIIDELEPCVECEVITEQDYCIIREYPFNPVGNWNLIDPNTAQLFMFDGLINYTVTITKQTANISFLPLGAVLQFGFVVGGEYDIQVNIDPPLNGNFGLGLIDLGAVPPEYLSNFNIGLPNRLQQPLYIDNNNQIKTLANIPGALITNWDNVELLTDVNFSMSAQTGNFISLITPFSRFLNPRTWKQLTYCDNTVKFIDETGHYVVQLPLGYTEINCDDCQVADKVEICNFHTFNNQQLCYYIPVEVTQVIITDGQTLVFVDPLTCNVSAFATGTPIGFEAGGVQVNRNQNEIYAISRSTPYELYTFDFTPTIINNVPVTGLNSANELIQSIELHPLTNEVWVLTKELAIPAGHLYTLDVVTGVLTFQGTITGGDFVQENDISILIDETGRFYVTWFQATGILPVTDTQLSEIDSTTFAYIGEAFDFTFANATFGATWTNANTIATLSNNFYNEFDANGNLIRQCNVPALTNTPDLATFTQLIVPEFGTFERVYEIYNDVIQKHSDHTLDGELLILPDNAIVVNCDTIEQVTEVLCDDNGQFLRHYSYVNNVMIDFFDTDFYNQDHILVGALRACNQLPALIECRESHEDCGTIILDETSNINADFTVNVNQLTPTIWELIFTGDQTDRDNLANLINSMPVNDYSHIGFAFAGGLVSSVSIISAISTLTELTVTIDFGLLPNQEYCLNQVGGSWEAIYGNWIAILSNVVFWPLLIPAGALLYQTAQVYGNDRLVEALPVAIVCDNFTDRELASYCYRAVVAGVGYNVGDVLRFNVLVDVFNVTNPPYINFQNVSQNLNVLWEVREGVSTGTAPNFADLVPCEAYGGTLPDLVDCNTNCNIQAFASIGVRDADVTVNVTNVGLVWTFEFLGTAANVNLIKPEVTIIGNPDGWWTIACLLGFSNGINASLINVLVDNPGQYIVEVDFTNIPITVCPTPDQQTTQTGLAQELANSGTTWTINPACLVESFLTTQIGLPQLALPVSIVCGNITTTNEDVEVVILCDDNGSFLRHIVYLAGAVNNIFDTELDGVTPYITVGAVVNCAENAAITPVIEGALLAIPGLGATLYTFTVPVQSVSIGNVDGGILELTFVTNPVSSSNNLQYVMPGGTLQVGFGDNIEIISINILNSSTSNITVLVNGVTSGRN